MRAPRRAAATVVVAALTVLAAAACFPQPTWPSGTTTTTTTTAAPPFDPGAVARTTAANWLLTQFGPDDVIPSPFVPGADDLPGTVSAVLSLLAADVGTSQAEASVAALAARLDELVSDGQADKPGSLAQLILAVVATGGDPTDVAGEDLVARLEATQQVAGPDAGLFGSQFALYDGAFRQGLALAALSIAAPTSATIAPAVTWLEAQQCADGSWMAYRADLAAPCAADPITFAMPETNSTAMALLGLTAVGEAPSLDGVGFLLAARSSDGGWSYPGGIDTSADPDSTALVMAALRATGNPPDQAAYDRLVAFQFDASAPAAHQGAFWYPPFDASPPVPSLVATNDAVLGLAGVWPQTLVG